MPYQIRLAAIDDLAALPSIERAAAALFPADDLPPALRAQTLPAQDLCDAQRQGRLWVAQAGDGTVAGFALASRSGAQAFLDEMDVHPAHARRGIGRALVAAVVQWARAQGLVSLGLTTFSHLPWNAPFYARLGFVALAPAALCPHLSAALAGEAALGLRRRVAMRLPLDAVAD